MAKCFPNYSCKVQMDSSKCLLSVFSQDNSLIGEKIEVGGWVRTEGNVCACLKQIIRGDSNIPIHTSCWMAFPDMLFNEEKLFF